MSTEPTGAQPAEQAPSRQTRTPGVLLRSQRKKKGYSQKEVADKLHITAHYVTAIEDDAYEKLPAAVFAKGYIKRYGEMLDLDTDELLEHFARLQAAEQASGDEPTHADPGKRRTGRRNLTLLLPLLLAVAVAAGIWAWTLLSDSQTSPSGSQAGTMGVQVGSTPSFGDGPPTWLGTGRKSGDIAGPVVTKRPVALVC